MFPQCFSALVIAVLVFQVVGFGAIARAEGESFEEENTSTVKLCKVDNEENPLTGWTLKLHDGFPGTEGDYSGITGENGCVTFEDVSYGTKELFEDMQEGWELVSEPEDTVVNESHETFTFVNRRTGGEKEDKATVIAQKIVCPTEDLLPNWGNHGPSITEGTASEFLAEHPTCELIDWEFEWALVNTPNPGDNTGEAGGAWTKFWDSTPTSIPTGKLIWVREVWNDNYIPFTGQNTTEDVSAEIYCNTDVLNYDNYDWIDPVEAGKNYYCIGFNVIAHDGNGGESDKPECSDDVDNADPEDTLVDEHDPGCHTDGNATNGDDTYNPHDDDETDEDDGTGGGGEDPECSDGIDNEDPEDAHADYPNDPGCTGPADDDETDSGNNGGGGGSSSGSRRSSGSPAGQVLGEETSCGINIDKYLRIGHANDPETVKKVQNFLNFYLNKNLSVDGIYGTATEAAVREFQILRSDNVLDPWGIEEPTGIFYLTTQTEVNNILCPDLNIAIPNPLINWSINPYVVLPPSVVA